MEDSTISQLSTSRYSAGEPKERQIQNVRSKMINTRKSVSTDDNDTFDRHAPRIEIDDVNDSFSGESSMSPGASPTKILPAILDFGIDPYPHSFDQNCNSRKR